MNVASAQEGMRKGGGGVHGERANTAIAKCKVFDVRLRGEDQSRGAGGENDMGGFLSARSYRPLKPSQGATAIGFRGEKDRLR